MKNQTPIHNNEKGKWIFVDMRGVVYDKQHNEYSFYKYIVYTPKIGSSWIK